MDIFALMINTVQTAIPGVVIIEPKVFGDARGYFEETWREEEFLKAGIGARFVQDNHSFSSKGVLRGLHWQKPPHSQGKLVSVISGRIVDVAVDIRKGSPTFGKWVMEELSEENHTSLWIPPGFAHGFMVLSDTAHFTYKCTDTYHPESEAGMRWNDPTLAIDWGISPEEVILSEKDGRAPWFRDAADNL